MPRDVGFPILWMALDSVPRGGRGEGKDFLINSHLKMDAARMKRPI